MPRPLLWLGWDSEYAADRTACAWHTDSESGKFPDGHDVVFYPDSQSIGCTCLGARVWHKTVALTGKDGCKHQKQVRRFLRGE